MSGAVVTTSTAIEVDIPVDARLSFLQRAHARLILVEAGEMDLDEAIDGLVDAFHQIRPCACTREIMERWERDYPPSKRRRSA
jgi:hypothetical protein